MRGLQGTPIYIAAHTGARRRDVAFQNREQPVLYPSTAPATRGKDTHPSLGGLWQGRGMGETATGEGSEGIGIEGRCLFLFMMRIFPHSCPNPRLGLKKPA